MVAVIRPRLVRAILAQLLFALARCCVARNSVGDAFARPFLPNAMAVYKTVPIGQLKESGLAPPITVAHFRIMIEAGLDSWVHQAFENTPTLKLTDSDRYEIVQEYRQSEPAHILEIVHLVLVLTDAYVHRVQTEYPEAEKGTHADERWGRCLWWLQGDHLGPPYILSCLVAARTECWLPYVWSAARRAVEALRIFAILSDATGEENLRLAATRIRDGAPIAVPEDEDAEEALLKDTEPLYSEDDDEDLASMLPIPAGFFRR